MEQRILTCICCPLGCLVTVELENREICSVIGNTCKRGEDYVRKEVISPTRIVTSSVKVIKGNAPTVSVKTKSSIPKEKIFDIINALKKVEVTAPIAIGDVILENVADTGVDIVATKAVKEVLIESESNCFDKG